MNDFEELNWDELPQEFRYLVDVTKAFATHSRDPENFLPTEEDIEFLAATVEKIRQNGGSEKIMDWVIDHEKFWEVGHVLALMNFIGFDLSKQS